MIIVTTSVMQKKKNVYLRFYVWFFFFSFFHSLFLNPKDGLYCQFNKTKRFGCLPWDKSTRMST